MGWDNIQSVFDWVIASFNFEAFTIDTFKQFMECHYQRPITLLPYPFGQTTLTGMWAATPTMDYISYDSESHLLHQEHIVLHEFAHMLLEHRPAPLSEMALFLFRNVDDMDSPEEQEAERLARLLMRQIVKQRRNQDFKSEYE
jgi:hypothetical protein